MIPPPVYQTSNVSMNKYKKINRQNVIIKPKENKLEKELSEDIYYECDFCEKEKVYSNLIRKQCERLSKDKFYCPFCIRNNFTVKCHKHILIMSFRAIFGFYYYEKYLQEKMWFSKIKCIIEDHQLIGLKNPVFQYDPETFLWFINFNRIGKGRKQLNLSHVLDTFEDMYDSIDITKYHLNIQEGKFKSRFIDAIEKFYTNRYRPEGKRLLIPTLVNCVDDKKMKYDLEQMRFFVQDDLKFS